MPEFEISKRGLLLGSAGALVGLRPGTGRAADMPVTVLLESEAVILDPHMTTAAITRTFGYHIWDTLFSMDGAGAIKPQMVESWDAAPDGRRWRFKLRDKLAFHDGAPVTAADVVASLQRWAPLDSLGRRLLAAGAKLDADGTDAFTIALDKPFPLMLQVLGKPNAPVPFIMPARIVTAAGTGRIKDMSAPDRSPSPPTSGGPATAWCSSGSPPTSPGRSRLISSPAARWSISTSWSCASSTTHRPGPVR